MIYIKKISLILAGMALGLTLLGGLYILSAYILSRVVVEKEKDSGEEIVIYILTNGVHTDLVLPLTTDEIDWSSKILFTNTISKDTTARWVAIGWGDKGFYLNTPTWADLTFSTAFKAAFSLSTSAIHATFYNDMRESETCRKIMIGKTQYKRLIAYVNNSFTKAENGEFINIKTTANYGINDAFYEAVGSYSLLYTCNTWANNGLKSCGQKACWWTPFDTGIFNLYKTK